MNAIEFDTVFSALTGNKPFPWLRKLYEDWFAQGKFPSSCNIPTGLGKTSVIAVWLIALANHPEKMPRRLVYVVNRRTVVDQTTNVVEDIRKKLNDAGVDKLLRKLCAIPLKDDELPLAISTLRGQFADNREWSADPCRPAVICGTVDMIGSRLLFSGYGIGFKAKPLHAGFLGQDVLLVHDEAHLEPAFQKLLIAIEKEQHHGERTGSLPWPKIRVMELSATSRGTDAFSLSDADRAEPEVQKRINAVKAIHPIDDEKKQLADKLVELALVHRDSQRAILVFARSVEAVTTIVAALRKVKQEVQQLTGTLRGLERDRMADPRKADACPIFARFLKPPKKDAPESEQWQVDPKPGTVYLVCTSAGEVGVNISADHLVCDLSTFDSMAQRFGRVNRFGERDDTRIDVVYPTKFDAKELDVRRSRTLELLKQLNGNGSPAALGDLDLAARLAAFAPKPEIFPTSDILFDAWALTTIRGKLPGRPPVEPYLHGISGWEPPETRVAWREEVGLISGELLDTYEPEDLLEDYPLKPHELLRDNSSRVFDRLKKLKAAADTPVWVVADDGSVTVTTRGDLIEAGQDDLAYKTVLLPPSAGGLHNGMLASDSETANDVADEWPDEQDNARRSRNVWDGDAPPDGMRLIRTIDTKPDADETEDEESMGRFWKWYVRPRSADDDGSRSAAHEQTLAEHVCLVEQHAKQFVSALNIAGTAEGQALISAAKWHDLGKDRQVWQQSIRNAEYPQKVLAKSGNNKPPLDLTGYRHEFGSLVDVESEPEFQQLSDDMKDLVRHLIAVHHGRGRPHFPKNKDVDEAFDPNAKDDDAAKLAAEVPRRFARLQRTYGRWGLAYLESLLRAADWAASANPSAFVEEKTK